MARLVVVESSSRSSCPLPSVGIWKSLVTPSRPEEKAIRVPSGFQTGCWSQAAWRVSGMLTPRDESISQMSVLPASLCWRRSAIRLPFGDSAGLRPPADSAPRLPVCFPSRFFMT